MHFELSSRHLLTDRAKVAYIISHLSGRAEAWAVTEWESEPLLCNSIQGFKEGLRKTFDPVSTEQERARELRGLKQGRESVCDYAICFHLGGAEWLEFRGTFFRFSERIGCVHPRATAVSGSASGPGFPHRPCYLYG